MAITLRSNKGMPLTIQEMDANFLQLDARLRDVEMCRSQAEALRVEQKNDVVLFKNGFGEALGQALLPQWRPRLRGGFEEGQFYAFGDWVRHEAGLYMCQEPHHAEVFAEAKWMLLLTAAGREQTDVASI